MYQVSGIEAELFKIISVPVLKLPSDNDMFHFDSSWRLNFHLILHYANTPIYLHFSKTSLDEPLDVHLCSYFHEQHCVTRRDVIQT